MKRNFITILAAGAALATYISVAAAPATLRHSRDARNSESIGERAPMRKAPVKRVTSGGSNIFGYLTYSENDADMPGLYALDNTGYTAMWEDPLLMRGAEIYTGWQRNGILNAIALQMNGSVAVPYIVQLDLYTGDIFDIQTMGKNYFTVLTFNENDGNVYGMACQDDGGWAFSRAASGAPGIITPICNLDKAHDFMSLTFNSDDAKMYGINKEFNFVTVGMDGTIDVLAHVDLPKEVGTYQTGIIYSPTEHLFYWNVNFVDDTAALYTIDPKTYAFELVENYQYCEEFAFFVSPDEKPNPAQPKAPSFVRSNFVDGALSGTVTFAMPDATEGGSAIEGNVDWTAWVDNVEYQSGSAAPGADVTLSFTDLAQGRHIFTISATSGGRTSSRGRQVLFIGPDVPKDPTDVALSGEGVLTWNAVTEGVEGGYVDVAAMRYHIYNDAEREIDVTSSTSWSTTLPADADLKAYRFGVRAEYGAGNTSETVWSNYRVVGRPLQVPLTLTPTPTQAVLFTIDDVNGDERGWRYDDGTEFGTEESFKCDYGHLDSNDWLFFPAVNFTDANKVYELAYQSRLLSDYFKQEYIQFFIGSEPTPEAMTAISDVLTPASREFRENVLLFLPGEVGVKYLGVKCTSVGDMAGVALRNFRFSESDIPVTTPRTVNDLVATAAPKGELKANVTFTMPSIDLAGKPLDANTNLVAHISTKAANGSVTVTGKPGEKISGSVNAVQGTNQVAVDVALNENAKNAGQVVAEVFVGIGMPGQVRGLSTFISADMLSVDISWDKVTDAAFEGYINPENVTYLVYVMDYNMQGAYWKLVGDNVKETSFTYSVPKGVPQQYEIFAVRASNEYGPSDYYGQTGAVLGTPYTLPMKEDFETMTSADDLKYEPYVSGQPSDGFTCDWQVILPEQISPTLADEPGYYFVAYGVAGSKGRMGLPRFKTPDSRIMFTLNSLSCYGIAPFSIYAEAYGVEPVLIATIPLFDAPYAHKNTYQLPDQFRNKEWVQIYLDCMVDAESQVACVRGYEITAPDAVEGIIDDVVADNTVTVVDLAGRVIMTDVPASRLSTLAPGLYIVNGKKYLVR